jgi:hypothetical protein
MCIQTSVQLSCRKGFLVEGGYLLAQTDVKSQKRNVKVREEKIEQRRKQMTRSQTPALLY